MSGPSPELLAACAKHVPSVKTDAHEAWLVCSCGMQSHRSGQTWSEWWITHTAEWVRAREQAARLEQLQNTPHYSGCATLLATRDPYPPCDCWVGERIRALAQPAAEPIRMVMGPDEDIPFTGKPGKLTKINKPPREHVHTPKESHDA